MVSSDWDASVLENVLTTSFKKRVLLVVDSVNREMTFQAARRHELDFYSENYSPSHAGSAVSPPLPQFSAPLLATPLEPLASESPRAGAVSESEPDPDSDFSTANPLQQPLAKSALIPAPATGSSTKRAVRA